MVDDVSNIKKEKRPRGRPRTTPTKKVMVKHGIVPDPAIDENNIEFMTDDLPEIKKIFSIFKSMMVQELLFVFTENEIQIHGVDHKQKSKIMATINCEKCIKYYCKERVVAVLQSDGVYNIINVIDKTYDTLEISSNAKYTRSSIRFTIKNETITEEYDVRLISSNKITSANPEEFDTEDYKLKFKLSNKMLKKIISNTKSFSDIISIRKIKKDPLTISFDDREQYVKSKYTIKDSEKIDLESSLDCDDIFNISVAIDYIRPIAFSAGSNFITMNLHDTKKIIARSTFGEGNIVVSISIPTMEQRSYT